MDYKNKYLIKSVYSVGGLVLVLLILMLLNIIFFRVNVRYDATEDKLYSLSEGTKQILSNLDEDVIIKVFYSKKMINVPVHIKAYAQRVLDFLSEYEHHANGKLSVEIHNTEVDSEDEEWAQEYGINGINLTTGETLYFGLVAMAADQEETIAFMDPSGEAHLEYDITRIISRVQSSKKSKIAIVAGLPVFGGAQPAFNPQNQNPALSPWLFVSELEKTYDVVKVDVNAEKIESDTDLLVIVQPAGLSEKIQYAVDQYVLKGGNLIVFADPLVTVNNSPGQSPPMKKLFDAWGVTLDTTRAVVDFDLSTPLRTRDNQVEENPFWISAGPESFNTDNIITAKLESMLLPIAGSIKKIPESRYEFEPLVQSSTNSQLVETFKARFGTNTIRYEFSPSNEKYNLAVKIGGEFKTAFPEGKLKRSADPADVDTQSLDKTEEKGLKQGIKKAAIVIVADTDMLFDDYYVDKQNLLGFNMARIFNDNLNFLLNTAEMLTGSKALISIRSRGKFERPFTRVNALEKKAQIRWLARERELVEKAEETNRKLKELELQKNASQKFIISEKQEAEINKFQSEKQEINKQLKQVRRNLRASIESLGSAIKFINLFFIPLLVGISGIVFAVYKRKKGLRS